MHPRDEVARIESAPALPAGAEERFGGYGIMGLPFASGHVLAMRRFPASSVGPGYHSVWHRWPDGRWDFFADVPPAHACTRFFGAVASVAEQCGIAMRWTGPARLEISVPAAGLEWACDLVATPVTRAMNTVMAALPASAWRRPLVLAAMGAVAGTALGAGTVGLVGVVPNGQRFTANPYRVWMIPRTQATLGGASLGAPGPLRPQARLGDFWIPQRGIFALGRAFFDPFDPAKHSARTVSAG